MSTMIERGPAVALCAALAMSPAAGHAAEPAASYPTKPVRLIIANTTGTSVDTLARVLTVKMAEVLGQQVVADNRGGAGGIIGAEIAANSAPDGYTLLVTSTGVQVISPQLYKKLSYDPIKSFAPISMFALTQNVLVVNPSLPVKSVKELIAYAKANPGKLNMSNAGTGFQSHLAGVLFAHMSGIDVRHVPYKGGSSLIALMGNETQLQIAPGPSLMGHVRAGRLRALGTGGEKRSPLMPDIPAISETVPGYVSTGWSGLMAPRGTPQPIIEKVRATLANVLNDPAARETLERQGAEPWMTPSSEMVKFIEAERQRFRQAIEIADVQPQ
jgi:tripartite-type tricarboxylate transporter receptor subunit TctC